MAGTAPEPGAAVAPASEPAPPRETHADTRDRRRHARHTPTRATHADTRDRRRQAPTRADTRRPGAAPGGQLGTLPHAAGPLPPAGGTTSGSSTSVRVVLVRVCFRKKLGLANRQ